MRIRIAAIVAVMVATACTTPGGSPSTADQELCEALRGVFVSVTERTAGDEDEGGPDRDTVSFEDGTATLVDGDAVEEGIVDCTGRDVLLRYSDAHSSEGEPMASSWIISTTAGPALWLRNEAFVPLDALVSDAVPASLAVSEVRGRVASLERQQGYSFARDGEWRMGPATISLANGSSIGVPAGTPLGGDCHDPDGPDLRDASCYLHAFVDGTGAAVLLWAGEIVAEQVRFFPPGRLGTGSRVGGLQFRFADDFEVRPPCDFVDGESPGDALARSLATSEEVEFWLDPDDGHILAITCLLAD